MTDNFQVYSLENYNELIARLKKYSLKTRTNFDLKFLENYFIKLNLLSEKLNEIQKDFYFNCNTLTDLLIRMNFIKNYNISNEKINDYFNVFDELFNIFNDITYDIISKVFQLIIITDNDSKDILYCVKYLLIELNSSQSLIKQIMNNLRN